MKRLLPMEGAALARWMGVEGPGRRLSHAARAGAAAALLGLSVGAQAGALALDFTGGAVRGPLPDVDLGWQFTLSQTTSISALGIWDESSDGLRTSHAVGIWTDTGMLLGSVVVPTAGATIQASAETGGRWLFQDLAAALVLGPGTYVIGADYPIGADGTADQTRDGTSGGMSLSSIAPGITFGGYRFASPGTPGLEFPDQALGLALGSFGPNFLIASPAAVPEPPALAVLLLAIGILAARRRSVA